MIHNINKNPIFEKRIVQVQTTLDANYAYLTVSPADVYYLTGCTGSNNHLLICLEEVYLFTDGRYTTQINEQTQVKINLIEIGVENSFEAALSKVLTDNNITLLKFSPDHMSYLLGKAMVSALPADARVSQDGILAQLRSIKDEMEIEIIRQNTLITKAAFLYIQSVIKPGMTEKDVATELEYYCKKQGAEGMSFSTIIASGTRSALPHGVASDKVINEGDLIQFDFGIVKDFYCSDFSRVMYMGEVDSRLDKIRDVVEEAVKYVEQHAECGMLGKEIDALARDYITEKGYGEFFTHGLGHSLGIEVHENPRLNSIWDKPIVENMVLTVEPGIYVPGLGGVRLEDVVVMRKKKFELITECGYEF